MPMMTKRERLAAAGAGKAVDRAPVALWRHFPTDDTDVEQLAQSVVAFQKMYDWDFVKITPASQYSVSGWGATITYRGHPEGTSEYLNRPITKVEQWADLKALNPHAGALGAQLACIQRVRELLGPEAVILETVFSPLDQARRLVGNGNEIVQLRKHPKELQTALEVLTATTEAFVKAALKAGADGIFYATQHASAERLSREEYTNFCRPLDFRILKAAKEGFFNLLHLHGQNTYLDLVKDYPVQALNWHGRETGPSLADGAELFPGLVIGGLSQKDLVEGNPETVRDLVVAALCETETSRVGLSTGCVLPTVAPWGNIRALRAAVELAKQ